MISVVIVDDEEPVCRYVSRILLSAGDIEVRGHALTGAEAVLLTERTRPAVVLLDVRMPGMDGLTTLEAILARPAPPAVVLLTNFNDEQVVLQAVHAGASGVLLKSASPADLIGVVRLTSAGHRVLGAGVRLPLVAAPGQLDEQALADLTRRERDVLNLLGLGLPNAQIAARLEVSEATVKGHVSALMTKLVCESRLQLGLFAHRSGLGRPG